MILNHLLIIFPALALLFNFTRFVNQQFISAVCWKLVLKFAVLFILSIFYSIVCFKLSSIASIAMLFSVLGYVRVYYLKLPLKSTIFIVAVLGVVAVPNDSVISPIENKEQSLDDLELPLISIVEVEHYVLPSGVKRYVLYSEQSDSILSKNVLSFVPTGDYERTKFSKMVISHYLNTIKLSFSIPISKSSQHLNDLNNSTLVAAYTHADSSRFSENIKLTENFDLCGGQRSQYLTPFFHTGKIGLMGPLYKSSYSPIANLGPNCVVALKCSEISRDQLFLASGTATHLKETGLILKQSGGIALVDFKSNYKPYAPVSILEESLQIREIAKKVKK